ncbi:hypothetical protein ACFSOZ_07185 [Mesorhizobium newzealandense]|uniref:LamG domain-containing protein n=1 Tax=Mesorhizobium newzealandense TaxID=1300302 RepID=A0ABW4U8Q5_9HYPH
MLMVNQLIGFGARRATAPAGPPPPLDGLSPTGAYSLSRDLLTSFAGNARYNGTTTASQLNDQTGAGSRNLAASPTNLTVQTAGPNSRTSAKCDAINQQFSGSVMSNFISATSGYYIASFLLWSAAGSNNLVFGDGNTNLGLYLQPGKLNSYNQGQWAPALGSGFAVSTATAYVAEWRHESGNLYCRLNGGSWSGATVSGNSTLTGALNIGGKGGSGQAPINFFEGATFSTVPSTTVQDALVADFKAWIGA